MTISPTTLLSKPEGEDRLRRPTLAYVLKRGRQQAYSFMVSEFKKSGISQATLARRMGRGADQISRLLRGPSNIEVDTIAEFLFAVNGGLVAYDVIFPGGAAKSEPRSNVIDMFEAKLQSTTKSAIEVEISNNAKLEFRVA